MKRILVSLLPTLLLATPVLANHTIAFSTVEGASYSWQLRNVAGAWQFSFANNATEVDSSVPSDAVLEGDFINLPTMVLSNIATPTPGPGQSPFLTATLTPQGDMTIRSNDASGGVPAGTNVLRASVEPGTLFLTGTNYDAYSAISDDLNIISFTPGYGTAIPALDADEDAGFALDLSFSGNAHTDLYQVLTGTNLAVVVTGNMSGEISSIIPAPGALLLAALGTCLIGLVRRRNSI